MLIRPHPPLAGDKRGCQPARNMLNRLALRYRFAERLAQLSVTPRLIKRRLRDPHSARCHVDPAQFQPGQRMF